MHETCLIIIHDPGMRPGPEYVSCLDGGNPRVRSIPHHLRTQMEGQRPLKAESRLVKRVYGQFCIETLHESRKRNSSGLFVRISTLT